MWSGGTTSGAIVDSGGTAVDHGRASGGTIDGGLFAVTSGSAANGRIAFVSGDTLRLDAGVRTAAHLGEVPSPGR